ncbi:MAG: hypothetical protein SNF68_08335 [Rikenellaceae bacterium]
MVTKCHQDEVGVEGKDQCTSRQLGVLQPIIVQNTNNPQSEYTFEKLMERFGKSESYVCSRMRLTSLIEEFRTLLTADYMLRLVVEILYGQCR